MLQRVRSDGMYENASQEGSDKRTEGCVPSRNVYQNVDQMESRGENKVAEVHQSADNPDGVYENILENDFKNSKNKGGMNNVEEFPLHSDNTDDLYDDVADLEKCKSNGKDGVNVVQSHNVYQSVDERERRCGKNRVVAEVHRLEDNADTVYEYISTSNLRKYQNKDGVNHVQGRTGIETISGALSKINGIVKVADEELSVEKASVSRGSSLEKLFYYDKWAKEKKYLLFSLSVSSGIGCLWRFPSVAYDTGGSFLLCYIIMLLVIGIPLYYLESAISQFSSSGPLKVWRCLPILKGIAFSQAIASLYLMIYVAYVMSLSLFYIITSMQYDLPWKNSIENVGCTDFKNSCEATIPWCEMKQTSAQAYWRAHLLQSDKNQFRYFNWKLGFCLLSTWIIIFLCYYKRTKIHGKVSLNLLYVACTFPCLGLLLCLSTIVVKDGCAEGIVYGLRPKLKDLNDIKIWYEACVHCFISLGVGFGHVFVYSRHNSYRENIPRNCAYIGIHNICITLLSSILFFSTLGVIAKSIASRSNKPLCYREGNADVISPIFIVFTEGLTFVPQLWTILLFTVVFLSALSNMMIYIESVSITLSQPWQAYRISAASCVCIFCGICGLLLTTNIGPMIVTSMDRYGVSVTIFACSVLQIVGILWFYGYKNYFRDIAIMTKSERNLLIKIYYTAFLPSALIVIGIGRIIDLANGSSYWTWVSIVGWVLVSIALAQLPIWIIEAYTQAPEWGWRNKLKCICKPEHDWGPVDPLYYRDWYNEKKGAPNVATIRFKQNYANTYV